MPEAKQIAESFAMVNKEEVDEASDNGEDQEADGEDEDKNQVGNIGAENGKVKQELEKAFNYYWLPKQIADYCNCSYQEVMKMPALEVAALALIIHKRTLYNSL